MRQITHLETKKENKKDARAMSATPVTCLAGRRPLCRAGDLTVAMPATCPAAT
jgi:hypothetical protein